MIQQLGHIDIYLLDQIMKNRILPSMQILDAGCGSGRNAQFFIQNNFNIRGIDKNEAAIEGIRENALHWNPQYDLSKFSVADLQKIPFPNTHFDFIICSAVLHFAENRSHFLKMMELLKSSYQFRVTGDIKRIRSLKLRL